MTIPQRIYTIILYLILPFVILRLYIKGMKSPEYGRRINERFGLIPEISANDIIWIHAVSVGEFIAAIPLIKNLKKTFPQKTILVTTTTPTGSDRARKTFGDEIIHYYAPYDLPYVIKRYIAKINPCLVVIMETELWPNLLYFLKQRGVPVILANARLSSRSCARYSRFNALTRSMLGNIDCICSRGVIDAQRFVALGADKEKVVVVGNVKYDFDIPMDLNECVERFRSDVLGEYKKILVAASTHEGEDAMILDAFNAVKDYEPNTLLILVPRHPERFDSVASLIAMMDFSFVRRSSFDACDGCDVYLGDSMGELLMYFAVADVAFIGGSLVDIGGHNPLEAMAFGVPVICGKYTYNFEEIMTQVIDSGSGVIVDNVDELSVKMVEFLKNPEEAKLVGMNGKNLVLENKGAVSKICSLVAKHIL